MTTRVLDVLRRRALATTPGPTRPALRERGVDERAAVAVGLQMYHRAIARPVSGPGALRFLLFDDRFPRALSPSLGEMEAGLCRCPDPTKCCPPAPRRGCTWPPSTSTPSTPTRLHRLADDLQMAIATVHDHVAASYFLPVPATSRS